MSWQTVIGFVTNPINTFNTWNYRQKLTFVSTGAVLTTYMIFKFRNKYIKHKLWHQGYRALDTSSMLNESVNRWDVPIHATMFGFEVADSRCLDFKSVQYFAHKISSNFINFRSCIYKKHGNFYYKEIPNFDSNKNVHLININDVTLSSNTNIDIQEELLHIGLEYINNNKMIDVNWAQHSETAPWDLFYLHFIKYNTCLLFIRVNHSLCDGFLLATLASIFHFGLFSNDKDAMLPQTDINQQNVNQMNKKEYNNLRDIIHKNMTKVFGSNVHKRSFSLSHKLCKLLTIPYAIYCMLIGVPLNKPDPKCCINRAIIGERKIAVSKPINIKEFKRIAHALHGTVNDLFLMIISKTLRKYMEINNDPYLEDNSFTHINAIGALSCRSFDRMTQDYIEYAVYGTNANQLYLTPYKQPIKDISVKAIQKCFAPIKFGYLNEFILGFVAFLTETVPFGRSLYLKAATDASTLMVSNLIAPKELFPIPAAKTNLNENAVNILFGLGSGGPMPFNITALTYNEHIRFGVCVDVGTINDPKEFMRRFMDQYLQISDTLLDQSPNMMQ